MCMYQQPQTPLQARRELVISLEFTYNVRIAECLCYDSSKKRNRGACAWRMATSFSGLTSCLASVGDLNTYIRVHPYL